MNVYSRSGVASRIVRLVPHAHVGQSSADDADDAGAESAGEDEEGFDSVVMMGSLRFGGS